MLITTHVIRHRCTDSGPGVCKCDHRRCNLPASLARATCSKAIKAITAAAQHVRALLDACSGAGLLL